MSAYEELVERCAREIWKEFQTNKKSSSASFARIAIAEVLRALETVTPEMIEAFTLQIRQSDPISICRLAMLLASPLAPPAGSP